MFTCCQPVPSFERNKKKGICQALQRSIWEHTEAIFGTRQQVHLFP
uniref:Uncharacterized protein n=1 Tax=Rhizophora mucronata TaxID=61149 RepID=A0A2P2L9N2_RHIMU